MDALRGPEKAKEIGDKVKLKVIITEIVVPRTEVEEIFSPQRVRIRLRNEGVGNYIAVEGINDEPLEGENGNEMYFESEQQIDEFARICKSCLSRRMPIQGEINPIDKLYQLKKDIREMAPTMVQVDEL